MFLKGKSLQSKHISNFLPMFEDVLRLSNVYINHIGWVMVSVLASSW